MIGYEEMLELASQGAQVMHTRAVELGWINGVEIAVRSTFSEHPGTRIKEDPDVEQRNKVRGLATDRKVAKVTLVSVPDAPGIARRVFEPLAEAGIHVDMIVQNVSHSGTTDISFTVNRVDLAKAKRLLEPVVREMDARELTTDSAIAKVSIVGAGIHNAPGYAARMFGALAENGVNIEMISTSEIRITCIIAEDELDRATRALHAAFSLEQPEEVVDPAEDPRRPRPWPPGAERGRPGYFLLYASQDDAVAVRGGRVPAQRHRLRGCGPRKPPVKTVGTAIASPWVASCRTRGRSA